MDGLPTGSEEGMFQRLRNYPSSDFLDLGFGFRDDRIKNFLTGTLAHKAPQLLQS